MIDFIALNRFHSYCKSLATLNLLSMFSAIFRKTAPTTLSHHHSFIHYQSSPLSIIRYPLSYHPLSAITPHSSSQLILRNNSFNVFIGKNNFIV